MTASTVEPSATPNGLSADTAPVGPELAAGWPPPAAHEASPPATGVSAAAVSAMRRNWRRRRGREVSISCLSSEVGCRPQGGPRRGWHGPASRVPPPAFCWLIIGPQRAGRGNNDLGSGQVPRHTVGPLSTTSSDRALRCLVRGGTNVLHETPLAPLEYRYSNTDARFFQYDGQLLHELATLATRGPR